MSWLDFVILATIAVGGYLGWRLGVARAAGAMVGVGAGVGLAQQYAPQLEPYVTQVVPSPGMAPIASFLVISVGVFVAGLTVGSIARRLLRFVLLGWLDRTAGLAAGTALILGLWAVGIGVVGPVVEHQWPGVVTGSQIGTTLQDYTPIVRSHTSGWMELLGER